MKKTINIIVIFMMCFIFNNYVVNASTLKYDFSNYYYERSDNGEHYTSWKLQNYYVDGQVAFCIGPGIPEGNPMYESTWEETGLPDDIKQKILLIAYYGYQYEGHQTQKFRAATQALLWETILGGNTKVTYSTKRYGAGTSYSVDEEKSIILDLISRHFLKPSFDGSNITIQNGTTVVLEDTNNVLNNYKLSSSEKVNISIEDNKIIITPTDIGEIDVKFVKKQDYDKSYSIFVGDGIQNMISGGNVEPVYSSLKIKSVGGKLEINKKGEEIKLTDSGFVYNKINLKGVKIGLYANEEIKDGKGIIKYNKDDLIKELLTDSNGYAYIDNLYFDNYYIKEISTVDNHLLDEERYYFELRDNDNEFSVVYQINLDNYLPKGELIFTKVDYATKDRLPNALIEIYTEFDELVYSNITNDNGEINIKYLPLGKYYIVEKEAPENYILDEEKYYFEITENEQVINYTMTNEVYEIPDTLLNETNLNLIKGIVLIITGVGVVLYYVKKK